MKRSKRVLAATSALGLGAYLAFEYVIERLG